MVALFNAIARRSFAFDCFAALTVIMTMMSSQKEEIILNFCLNRMEK